MLYHNLYIEIDINFSLIKLLNINPLYDTFPNRGIQLLKYKNCKFLLQISTNNQ